MKNRVLQIGTILASASLIVVVGATLFASVRQYSETNLLNETLNSSGQDAEVPLSYETRIAKGDQLFEAGYYDLAANEYGLASKIDDEIVEAHMKLGKAYLKLGNYEQAVGEMDRAYEISATDETRTNYGIALVRSKNFELAKETLSGVNENYQSGVFELAMLNAYLGDYEAAKKGFEQAVKIGGPVPVEKIQEFQNAFTSYEAQEGGQTIYLRALLGKAFINAEEFPMAEELALQVLNEKNDYRDVWILLGYAELKTEKYAEAEDAFKEAKRLDAVKPETHYFLGMAHFEQAEYSEAVDSFELALLYGFQPESESYLKIAESQTFLGNNEDAVAAYEYLVKIDQNDVNLFVEPIRLTMDVLGDLDRALTLAGEATSYFPGEAQSHTLLAKVYVKRGELDLALTSVETALDIDPGFAEAHYALGEVKMAQGNSEDAKNEFKKAYELADSGSNLSVQAAEKYNALILSPLSPTP